MEAEEARRLEREQLYQEGTAGMDMGGGGMVPTGAEHLYSEMEGDARGHGGARRGLEGEDDVERGVGGLGTQCCGWWWWRKRKEGEKLR